MQRGGWTHTPTETIRWIDGFMWTGQLDRASTLSLAVLPKLLAEPDAEYPDERFWARSIGTMLRCVALADSPARALVFLERAIETANGNLSLKRQVNLLVGAGAYPLFLEGGAGSSEVSFQILVKLIDIDCQHWTNLARRQKFDLMLLAEISVRIIEAFQIALVSRVAVPKVLCESAIILYRVHSELDLFEAPARDTEEERVLGFALRHLVAATALAGRSIGMECSIDPRHRGLSLTGPLAFDVLFVELFAHDGSELVSTANLLVQSVHAWRAATCADSTRRALRRHLSAFSCAIIQRLKEALRIDGTSALASLLAHAEEVLGPARHIFDRLSIATDSHTGFPAIAPTNWLPDTSPVGSNATVVQAIEDGGDLLLIAHHATSTEARYGRAQVSRIKHGAHNLAAVAYRYLGSSGIVARTVRETERLPTGSKSSDRKKLLDPMIEQFAAQTACILGEAFRDLDVDGRDLLFVSGSPHLLGLPLSIIECAGKRVIERVQSLTFFPSIGAAQYLAARAFAPGPFEIAAYCHTTDEFGKAKLQWNRFYYDDDNNLTELGLLCRTLHISRSNGPQVKKQTINAYSKDDPECNVLMVAGHGDPKKGIWLADGYWKPEDIMTQGSRLAKTECTILPSCRLGEIHWDSIGSDGEYDSSKMEISGFTASLCFAGIPRVLACPWTCYDIPVCRLIPMIVKSAIEKRSDPNPEPHYWARAIHDVVVEGLRLSWKAVGLYDVANLMLFGAP